MTRVSAEVSHVAFLPALLAAVVLLCPRSGLAQSERSRGEVHAGAGFTRYGGDEGSLGDGAAFVAGVSVPVLSRLAVGAEFMQFNFDRDFSSGVRFDGDASGVFAKVSYHFSQSRNQPYVFGSVGFLRSQVSTEFPGNIPRVESEASEAAWGGGAGVRISLSDRIFMQPQASYLRSDATGVLGVISATLSLGYAW